MNRQKSEYIRGVIKSYNVIFILCLHDFLVEGQFSFLLFQVFIYYQNNPQAVSLK